MQTGRRLTQNKLQPNADNYMKIREVIKAFCAIEKDNKILLIKEIGDGFWRFPGRPIEVEAGNERGVAREVFEQTGLQVAAEEIFHVEDYFHPNKTGERHNLTFFKARIIDGEEKPQPGEIKEMKWFSNAELKNLGPSEFDPIHQEALKQYLN